MNKSKLIRQIVLASIFFLTASSPVSALSAIQKQLYDSGIYYYDDSTSDNSVLCGSDGIVTGETGTGPLVGPNFPDVANPSDLVGLIQTYIQNARSDSPLSSYAAVFVHFGQQYNVNPVLVVAMAQKETSLGTAGNGTPSGGYNITNLRPHGFAVYGSYNEGIEASYKNLAGNLYLGAPTNYTSVSQIINRWAPPSDNNDTSGYIDFVVATLHKVLDGVPETGGATQASTSNSNSAASSNNSAGGGGDGATANSSTGNLDLSSIVSKNGLQSIEVKQVGGPILGEVNSDKPPVAPASVMKIIIADAFLRTNPDLSSYATLKSNELYSSSDGTVGQQYQLKDVVNRTLSETSWDSGANILIDQIGGLTTATKAVHALGYTSTDVNAYYHDPPAGVKQTTVADLTKAMEYIYTASGNNYGVAQDAMQGENHWQIDPAPDESKWGGTSSVAGNSGVFSVGSNKVIITLYKNEGQTTAGASLKAATEAVLDQLNGNPSSFTPGTVSGSQCQSTSVYEAGANGYDLSGANAMVNFHQCDPQWKDKPYGPESICAAGCGITSLAMVIDTLKGSSDTPDVYASKYGSYDQGGTVWSLWPQAAKDYGLNEQDIGSDFGQAATIIRQGGLIIIPVDGSGGGYFTKGGHLMVIRAVDDKGNFYLADPGTNSDGINSYGHNTDATPYSAEFLQTHGFMGSLFAFTQKS